MASESHVRSHHVALPHPPAVPTYERTMATRQKILLTAMFPVVYSMEGAACTLEVLGSADPTSAWVVSGDDPGECTILVTPEESHDDHLPAVVLVHVERPATVLIIADPVTQKGG